MKKFKTLKEGFYQNRPPSRPSFNPKWDSNKFSGEEPHANTANSVSESAMSQAKQFMKQKTNDVKHAAAFHVRSKGKSLETNKVSANATNESYKVGDLVHLGFGGKGGAGHYGHVVKMDKHVVHVKIGRDKYGDRIVEGPHKHVTPEKQMNEGLTGPTRMQLQQYFEKTVGSLRARIYRTEQAFGVYDIQVNSRGEIIYFKQKPEHHHTSYGVNSFSGNDLNVPLHESYEDHTTNKFHKVLTKHGFVHEKTWHENNLGATSHHRYTHPAHGKSHVDVMRFHSGGSDHFTHRHEQTNGIIGPYAAGDTKPHLDRHLGRMYGGLKESHTSLLIKELFEKAKDKKDPKKDKEGGFPPKDDKGGFPPKEGDAPMDAPKDKNADLKKSDREKEDAIKLSGKKEKFNEDPKLEPIQYMDGQGMAGV